MSCEPSRPKKAESELVYSCKLVVILDLEVIRINPIVIVHANFCVFVPNTILGNLTIFISIGV